MKKIPVFALLLFSCLSCSLFGQNSLPDRWEPGMTIQLTYGGGMRYYSYELLVSDTGSYYMENNEGRIIKSKIHFYKDQLDNLLAFLKEQQFDQIQSELTAPMHDKGSELITIQWGQKKIAIGTGHAKEIIDAHKSRYLKVRNYLQQMRSSKNN